MPADGYLRRLVGLVGRSSVGWPVLVAHRTQPYVPIDDGRLMVILRETWQLAAGLICMLIMIVNLNLRLLKVFRVRETQSLFTK